MEQIKKTLQNLQTTEPQSSIKIKDSEEAFEDVELTAEEEEAIIKAALLEAKHKKYAKLNAEKYWAKVRQGPTYPSYTAEEFGNYLITDFSKQVYGIDDNGNSKFKVTKYIEPIFWGMCQYFTHDPKSPFNIEKGLFLYGGVGVGKTKLMELFRFNQTNSYAIFASRKVADDYSEHGAAAISRYKTLLKSSDESKTFGQKEIGVCYDDLGTENEKQHFGNRVNVMTEIILDRYDNHSFLKGKTHFTTNLSYDELEPRYGTRALSRLSEMFNLIKFSTDAPDMRRQK